jgi:hypothetical protein
VITSTSNIGYPEPSIPGSAYSTDEGLSWTQIDNLPHAKAAFASARVGWSGGANDSIYKWDNTLLVTTVGQSKGIVGDFRLEQNYPNPFNPSTTIRYVLPYRSHVTLTVYNMLGQQVAQIVNGEVDAGNHDVQFNASNLASGVYFYRIQAGNFVESKALLLVK